MVAGSTSPFVVWASAAARTLVMPAWSKQRLREDKEGEMTFSPLMDVSWDGSVDVFDALTSHALTGLDVVVFYPLLLVGMEAAELDAVCPELEESLRLRRELKALSPSHPLLADDPFLPCLAQVVRVPASLTGEELHARPEYKLVRDILAHLASLRSAIAGLRAQFAPRTTSSTSKATPTPKSKAAGRSTASSRPKTPVVGSKKGVPKASSSAKRPAPARMVATPLWKLAAAKASTSAKRTAPTKKTVTPGARTPTAEADELEDDSMEMSAEAKALVPTYIPRCLRNTRHVPPDAEKEFLSRSIFRQCKLKVSVDGIYGPSKLRMVFFPGDGNGGPGGRGAQVMCWVLGDSGVRPFSCSHTVLISSLL